MQTIILNSNKDAFDLLIILQDYAATKSEQIAQAIQDEKAGKPVCLFNDYVDFIAALEAWRGNAKKFMKLIQRQTGERVLNDKAIDSL
jgi:hypothetical protein